MGDKTGIAWTDHTMNFWMGCDRVTAGCDHCYMFRDMERYGRDPSKVVRTTDATFYRPLKAKNWQAGDRIFVCSWSDFFHPDADEWRADAWDVIRRTPQYQYQILTKRPNRIARSLPPDWPLRNVWLGATVESREYLWRLRYLYAVPARVRFASYEPAVGPLAVEATDTEQLARLDWLIIGGESGGKEARPFPLEWARDALFAAEWGHVAPFVKQLGSQWAREHHAKDWHGGDPMEWSEDLRVRQFPTVAQLT